MSKTTITKKAFVRQRASFTESWPATEPGLPTKAGFDIGRAVARALKDLLASSSPEILSLGPINATQLAGVEARLDEIDTRLGDLSSVIEQHPVVKTSYLYDLDSAEFLVRHPIPIVIEEYDVEVTASWPEVEAFGSGSTASESILALKNDIKSLYDDLCQTPEENLGVLAQSWKRTMGALITKNERD